MDGAIRKEYRRFTIGLNGKFTQKSARKNNMLSLSIVKLCGGTPTVNSPDTATVAWPDRGSSSMRRNTRGLALEVRHLQVVDPVAIVLGNDFEFDIAEAGQRFRLLQ